MDTLGDFLALYVTPADVQDRAHQVEELARQVQERTEESFPWASRFRRLGRDYERLATILAGFHWLASICLEFRTLQSA